MTTKQIKRWMNLGGVVVGLAGLAVLAWGFAAPPHVPVPELVQAGSSSGTLEAKQQTDAQRGPTRQALQTIAVIDLRKPLRDPPPKAVARVALQAQLVGTLYEPSDPDASTALIRLADGNQRLLKRGEKFSDPAGLVMIKSVGDQLVVIDLAGEERELKAATP